MPFCSRHQHYAAITFKCPHGELCPRHMAEHAKDERECLNRAAEQLRQAVDEMCRELAIVISERVVPAILQLQDAIVIAFEDVVSRIADCYPGGPAYGPPAPRHWWDALWQKLCRRRRPNVLRDVSLTGVELTANPLPGQEFTTVTKGENGGGGRVADK